MARLLSRIRARSSGKAFRAVLVIAVLATAAGTGWEATTGWRAAPAAGATATPASGAHAAKLTAGGSGAQATTGWGATPVGTDGTDTTGWGATPVGTDGTDTTGWGATPVGTDGTDTTGWGATPVGTDGTDTTGWGAAPVTLAAPGGTTGWGATPVGTDGTDTTGWGATPVTLTAAAPARPGTAQAIRLTAAVLPVGPLRPGHRLAPAGGVCSVPGIGDVGGLLGFCSAGSSGVVGQLNNICQPSVPTPESATGGTDSLIRPPAAAANPHPTLYDRYGVAGQTWSAYDMQCSDMAAMIGNNVAAIVFDAAKALDRVTITVYQSAAGEGILTWLTSAVDRLVTSLGNAIYFPYLAPVVILGAIWLAWQGLIRKRATRTIEGTLWMVVACAAAIWLIGRPADFTGFGKTVSDGITQTLNVAFAKLPAPQQGSCVPLTKNDPQAPTVTGYSYTAGNSAVDQNANELWTVLVCKPWLDGEFGTTAYAAGGSGHPTVVNRYGRQLLWAQTIAANEKPTPSLIQAKQDTFAGIAASLKQNSPAVYPLFQGKQWTTRLQIAFAALFAALIAGVLVLLIAITLIILKLGFLLLLVAGPFFLIVGTHPGFGRVIAQRWAEMLIGVLLKQGAVALVLSILLYAYSLIMGTSDAVLPWALKILMIALVTVAVFIYRKPFAHLFSAVGYGMIGSRDRAEAGLSQAARAAGRNTLDAATVAVPGFGAYRVARWARRNPEQAASLVAQVATAGAAGAGAAAAGAAAGGSGAGEGPPPGSDGGGAGAADGSYQGSAGRPGVSARAKARGDGGTASGQGRTPPPLELPPRQPGHESGQSSGWARGSQRAGHANAGSSRPAPPPVPREAPQPAGRPAWPGSRAQSRSAGNGAARATPPASNGSAASQPAAARTRAAASSGSRPPAVPAPPAFGQQNKAGPAGGAAGRSWRRPFRRQK